MRFAILLPCLHIAVVLAQDDIITCAVQPVAPFADITLTCHFPEDLSATKKDFTVYHYTTDASLETIVDCWWLGGKLDCYVSRGVEYNRTVSRDLTVRLQRMTSELTGMYACQVAGYGASSLQTCEFKFQLETHNHMDNSENTKNVTKEENTALNIGITIGLVTTCLTVVIVVTLLVRRKRASRNQQTSRKEPQLVPLLPIVYDPDHRMKTKEFQEYLEMETRAMFPNMFDTLYFVPPVYFNKIQFKTKSVAGQVVFVPKRPYPNDFRHDQAMHRVLTCLRYMAEHDQEKMFVLTQFKYDDYLKSPGNEFKRHRMPVPAGLTEENQNIQCFDLMIVHRRYGLLVGVVKAVGDSVSQDGQQPTNDVIVHEISEAVQQLKKAERMIRHLMSDQKPFLRVRQTLILPNVARTTLQHALADHVDLVQELRECLGAEDPTSLCLCAEDLADAELLQDPSMVSHVITTLRECLQLTASSTEDDVGMTDGLYLSVLARFCGPATQSSLECKNESISLPKTQLDALGVTGDLYQRPILYQDMLDLLPEERLCLVGPPNTGKTRLLTLAGLNWLTTGHDVHVLCGPSGAQDSVVLAFLNQWTQNIEGPQTDIVSHGSVFRVNCNFNRKKDMEDTLKSLITKKGEKALCVLADDVDTIGSQFKLFCETLKGQYPDLHLWITSSSNKNVPGGWKVETFSRALNCPPSVAREASRAGANYTVSSGRNQAPRCLSPTEGPDVEYIYHSGIRLTLHNCTECGRIVADYLLKIRKENSVATVEKTSASMSFTLVEEESKALKRFDLQVKDVLVLYERNGQQLIDGLKSSGIPVCTLEANKNKEVSERENDSACVMHVDMLKTYRPRRKIVVYVEYKSKPKEPSHKWRGITSCTSQLIVMRKNH